MDLINLFEEDVRKLKQTLELSEDGSKIQAYIDELEDYFVKYKKEPSDEYFNKMLNIFDRASRIAMVYANVRSQRISKT